MNNGAEYVAIQEALSTQKQYLLEGRLGEGAYGQVFKAKCPKGKAYAIKIIPEDNSRVKYQKGELDALVKLNQLQESKRHFIKYYKSFLLKVGGETKLCIQMEMCSGDLRTFVYKNRNFDPRNSEAVQGPRIYEHVFEQILNGLVFIHSINWVHRDIHPGNILVANTNPQQIVTNISDIRDMSDVHIKIGDFGLAKNIGIEYEVSPGLTLHPRPEQSTPGMDGLYTAPELLTTRYNEKVDLYSAGIVLYFISRYPENENEWIAELKGLIQGNLNLHERLLYKDNKLITLITDLLGKNPNERPSARKAKKFMFPETKDTTDGNNASKTEFFARKENEEDLHLCLLSKFTLPALRAEIERRTGVKSYNQKLRQERTVAGRKARIIIQDTEVVEHIFKNAAQSDIVVVVTEEANDHNTTTEQIACVGEQAIKQMHSEDVVMNSA